MTLHHSKYKCFRHFANYIDGGLTYQQFRALCISEENKAMRKEYAKRNKECPIDITGNPLSFDELDTIEGKELCLTEY